MNDQVASPVSQSSDVNYEESVINLQQALVIVISIVSLVETAVHGTSLTNQPTGQKLTKH